MLLVNVSNHVACVLCHNNSEETLKHRFFHLFHLVELAGIFWGSLGICHRKLSAWLSMQKSTFPSLFYESVYHLRLEHLETTNGKVFHPQQPSIQNGKNLFKARTHSACAQSEGANQTPRLQLARQSKLDSPSLEECTLLSFLVLYIRFFIYNIFFTPQGLPLRFPGKKKKNRENYPLIKSLFQKRIAHESTCRVFCSVI